VALVIGTACTGGGAVEALPPSAATPSAATPSAATPSAVRSPDAPTTSRASSQEGQMDFELQRCLTGHWIHSHEEDTEGTTVYRRPSYRFPPARGRQGFELFEDGRAVVFGIAAADGSTQQEATWRLEDPRTLEITPTRADAGAGRWQIVACDPERLDARPDSASR